MKGEFPVYDICMFSNDERQDVVVDHFADYIAKLPYLYFPHRHDFYHLVLFTEGQGSHSIDFQNFKVKPYQFYFMIPGQVHSWFFEGKTDGYVLNFSKSFLQSFLLNPDYLENFSFFTAHVEDSVIEVPLQVRKEVVELFNKMVKEGKNQSDKTHSHDLIRVVMLQLFLLLSKESPKERYSKVPSYNQKILKDFEKLIDQNYLTVRLPKNYAQMLFITPNHLNAVCNEVFGISAGEMIRRRIALEAKRMLINFDMTVTEIGNILKFEDNSYFCKFFKKQTGISPGEFRKQITASKSES